jgi:DNA-binding response OmpR family regulator
MIAEDDLLMADMLEEVLVASGFEVRGIARTVEEGVALAAPGHRRPALEQLPPRIPA